MTLSQGDVLKPIRRAVSVLPATTAMHSRSATPLVRPTLVIIMHLRFLVRTLYPLDGPSHNICVTNFFRGSFGHGGKILGYCCGVLRGQDVNGREREWATVKLVTLNEPSERNSLVGQF